MQIKNICNKIEIENLEMKNDLTIRNFISNKTLPN